MSPGFLIGLGLALVTFFPARTRGSSPGVLQHTPPTSSLARESLSLLRLLKSSLKGDDLALGDKKALQDFILGTSYGQEKRLTKDIARELKIITLRPEAIRTLLQDIKDLKGAGGLQPSPEGPQKHRIIKELAIFSSILERFIQLTEKGLAHIYRPSHDPQSFVIVIDTLEPTKIP